VGSRAAIELQVIVGLLSKFHSKDLVLTNSLSRGGGSVRRRNALHEVGGRVPEVPRVRNARAGSETHTNFNIFTHTHLRTQNNFIKYLPKKVLKYSEF
jgi:hypothetical protein